MPDPALVEVSEMPYLFVTKSCSVNPEDISAKMGEAFWQVQELMQAKGIEPANGGLLVSHEYHPDKLTFRAGLIVARDDMAKAGGQIEADVTPAGQVLHFVHKGAYGTLHDDYALMMEHIARIGRERSAPTWEVYLNDSNQVAEEDLLTEIYASLKQPSTEPGAMRSQHVASAYPGARLIIAQDGKGRDARIGIPLTRAVATPDGARPDPAIDATAPGRILIRQY